MSTDFFNWEKRRAIYFTCGISIDHIYTAEPNTRRKNHCASTKMSQMCKKKTVLKSILNNSCQVDFHNVILFQDKIQP